MKMLTKQMNMKGILFFLSLAQFIYIDNNSLFANKSKGPLFVFPYLGFASFFPALSEKRLMNWLYMVGRIPYCFKKMRRILIAILNSCLPSYINVGWIGHVSSLGEYITAYP
jgi:hypothetical protein